MFPVQFCLLLLCKTAQWETAPVFPTMSTIHLRRHPRTASAHQIPHATKQARGSHHTATPDSSSILCLFNLLPKTFTYSISFLSLWTNPNEATAQRPASKKKESPLMYLTTQWGSALLITAKNVSIWTWRSSTIFKMYERALVFNPLPQVTVLSQTSHSHTCAEHTHSSHSW